MYSYSGRTFTVLTLLFLCFTSFAFGQNVTLTLGSGTVQPGGSVTVPLTLSGGMQPAAVQWTLLYPSSILSITTADGPAAAAAGKNSTCASSTGQTICIVAGLNQNTMSDGVIASVTFQVASSAAGSISVQMTGVVAASLEATAIPSGGVGGALTVAAPAAPSITAMTCNPVTLTGAGTASCTVSLDMAAGLGGVVIGLSSSNSNVSVPASLSIPAGSASGSFTATAAAITGANQTAVLTGTLGSSSQSASLTLVAPPQMSSLSCGATALAPGASTTCTVSLVAAAPAEGVIVTLSRSTAAITIPGTVGVAGGASTAQFTATAAASATDQTVTLTASAGSSSKTVSLTITTPPQISGMACSPASLTAGDSASCTVTLVAPAPAGGAAVALSSSASAITAPASVTIAAGMDSTQFSIESLASADSQTVTLTASLGSSSVTASIAIAAAPVFLLHGDTSEITGTAAGTPVRPANAPSGLTGTVNVRGNGYMSFAPVQNGYGLQFHTGGRQNTNTSFINFTGAEVGQLFKDQGEISFYLKSAYSFAERKALTGRNYRFAWDVFDDSGRLFFFTLYTTGNRLALSYSAWTSATSSYYVPAGQEDTIFGKDTVTKIRMAWDGSTIRLYINDQWVNSSSYTKRTPNWTAISSFTVGAQSPRANGGGNFVMDDAIADLQIY
jgi:hypothetical protein